MAERKGRSRRANGEGSIFQRKSGQWVCMLTVPTMSGGVRRYSKLAKSKAHAAQKLEDLRKKHTFALRSSEEITVLDLVARWIDSVREESELSTVHGYERERDSRIAPTVGAVPLHKLEPLLLQEWADGMRANNVGPRTRQMAFSVLRRACDFAVLMKLITVNPMTALRRPKAPSKKIQIFTLAEIETIIAAAECLNDQAVFVLAFTTGMRQGELFGLRWGDVDLGRGTLLVQRQARDYRGTIHFKKPKTNAGTRTFPLATRAIEVLTLLKASRPGVGSDDLVFLSPKGRVVRSTTFGGRIWRPLLRKLKLAPRGFHHTRHTAATLMLQRGIAARTVAHVLGHAHPGALQNMYSHLIPGDVDRIKATLDAVMTECQTAVKTPPVTSAAS